MIIKKKHKINISYYKYKIINNKTKLWTKSYKNTQLQDGRSYTMSSIPIDFLKSLDSVTVKYHRYEIHIIDSTPYGNISLISKIISFCEIRIS